MAGIPTKPNLDKLIINFADQLAAFHHGSCWLANGAFGSIADIPAETITNQDAFRAFLEATFDELSDLGEKPGKEDSKVEKLKTTNYIIDGKRINTLSLNLVGINQERKDWLESQLNSEVRTIVLLSANKSSALVFNGMRWSYDRSTELNGLNNSTISTEYSGLTVDRYFIIKDIPATAV